jgi:Copper type II ascorbate-dependent monooxygenase, C-terminal domain
MTSFRSRALAIPTLFSLSLVVAGCSSGDPATDAAAGAGAAGSTSGAGGAGAGTSSSSGTGGVWDPGGEITTYEGAMGPITVQPGAESTQCITVRLGNPEGAFVRRFRAALSQGSHHMIVYRSNQTTEDTTPKNCQGFSGLLSGEHPIFIAQQAESQLEFPRDEANKPVGLEIEADQMVKIEMHYFNTGVSPADVDGKLMVDTIPLSADVTPSDLAFWGTNDINIPPHAPYDTGVRFQLGLGSTWTFALTTHQHHLGTRMRVWHAINKDDTSVPVADSTNWSDPPLEIFEQPLEFPDAGGTYSSKGFAYQCEYNNTTDQQVVFGEGIDDEMCFLWHYYYPSQGFHLCFNGLCL